MTQMAYPSALPNGDMDVPPLTTSPVKRTDFEAWISPELKAIERAVDQAMERSGLAPEAIDRVFLTGGTSFVPAVRGLFTERFGAGKVTTGGEFVSVAEGLALIGRDRLVG